MPDRSDSVGFLKTNNRYAEKIPVTNNKGSPELTPEAMYVIDTNINTEISISDLTVNSYSNSLNIVDQNVTLKILRINQRGIICSFKIYH